MNIIDSLFWIRKVPIWEICHATSENRHFPGRVDRISWKQFDFLQLLYDTEAVYCLKTKKPHPDGCGKGFRVVRSS